ncbi:MAG: N-6 DNA methylase, partial [Candidatus Dechloromonas phosphoritropha]
MSESLLCGIPFDDMQNLSEIFKDVNVRSSLVQFTDVHIARLESSLFEKNGKTMLKCLATGKEKLAKPEEIVRQLWLLELTETYGYPLSRIHIEYPITFGRDTSKRADIVVMDADHADTPYIIVKVKATKLKDGKEQLRSYTHAKGAPLALWSNGALAVIWHRKNPNYFVEIPDLPKVTQTIDDIAGQPWTIDVLIDIENKRMAEGKGARSLKQLIEDMEDEVLANAGVDAFEEVFKLIFTKLYDEMYCFRGRHKYLRFRNSNTAAQLKANIQSLFDDAKNQWPGVFQGDDKLKLSPEHLQVCVGSLEEWKLFNSNLDVVDEAFEYLVNKSSKGEKGQYFTPRWVIDMCVKMMNPQEAETVIDTACGSAGFTVHAIFHVWKQILEDEGLPVSHLFTMEDKPQRCKDYVADKVFAIDFDEKSVRVARCLNLIAGDGQTNVPHLNTLDYPRWDKRIKDDEEWQETYGPGWTKLKKLRAEKNANRNFQFDVLMANPPFAGDIKQSDMLSPYELGHKANGKLESKVGSDLLFIERNLDFLRLGGRMAVVLPQGRFNNASDKRVREYIAERCRILAVVGLHLNTFKPHTGTKTSVLFVQKWNDDASNPQYHCPKVADYPIFFATQQKAAKDNSG